MDDMIHFVPSSVSNVASESVSILLMLFICWSFLIILVILFLTELCLRYGSIETTSWSRMYHISGLVVSVQRKIPYGV